MAIGPETGRLIDPLIFLEPGLPSLPAELMLARDRGEVLFLTGAGVSRPPPSSLPDFRGLVVDICAEVDHGLAAAIQALQAGEIAALTKTPPEAAPAWHTYTAALDPGQKAEFKRYFDGDYDVALGMIERRLGDARSGVASKSRRKEDSRRET